MSQSKCALLKPVDKLTGNFFLFSQYAQDLTKQYSNPDSYRCVPSKYIAMNLDYSTLNGSTQEELGAHLGEVFQNYYENSCAFLRSELGDSWSPLYATTLLFQTLERYAFINLENLREPISDDPSDTIDGTELGSSSVISGISDAIQYIGDINIYSYDDNNDGIGYNEIYCYIPNDAKCTDYRMTAVPTGASRTYTGTSICGYEGHTSYNGLDWSLFPQDYVPFIDSDSIGNNCYGIGVYGNPSENHVLVPQCLQESGSADHPRTDPETGEELDKFNVNTIIVLYDIVCKSDYGTTVLFKNVPLGIYFCGRLEMENSVVDMTNIITKYVYSGQIYNQGTSYGLRICTRFLTNPNSTEIIEQTVNGSTNVAELAPVLEKMGETLAAAENILNDKDKFYRMIEDHLAQFKDNKVNVPYVRQLGKKKYWFVNGKNTGAIAQYEYTSPEDIVSDAITAIKDVVFTKDDITYILSRFLTKNEYEQSISGYARKEYVDTKIEELKHELLVYLQGNEE